jgi:septal ring factor EnvC (AmiA/AmiB activator)
MGYLTKNINIKAMKKRAFLLLFFGLSCLLFIPELSAQKNADPTLSAVVLDDKSQKKVDQARVDLAKNQQKLNKEIVNYEKEKTKYDKDIKQGKLSPDDKEKGEKKLTKMNVNIGKLKKKIADSEAFLAKYNL